MEHRAARRYYRRVNRLLVCGRTDRKRLLAQLRGLLEIFFEENPEADAAALSAAFGEPEIFAEELLSTLREGKVEAARRRRRLLRLGFFCAAALVLLLLFWCVRHGQTLEPGASVLAFFQGPRL